MKRNGAGPPATSALASSSSHSGQLLAINPHTTNYPIRTRSEELGAGFMPLYGVNRLDLTLEALIHDNPKWHALFSEEELAICAARPGRYGYHKMVGDGQWPGSFSSCVATTISTVSSDSCPIR